MQQKLTDMVISYTLNGIKHTHPLTTNREDTDKQSFVRVGLADKSPLLISRQGVYIPKDKAKSKDRKS